MEGEQKKALKQTHIVMPHYFNMKTPTKKQKLEWIKAARLCAHARALEGSPAFTCLAFANTSGSQALSWYVGTTVFTMGAGFRAYHELYSTDFDIAGEGAERNAARLLYLAMMETLVKANEV